MEFTPSRLISYLEVDEVCEVIGCAKCIVMGGEQFSAKAFNGVKQYTDAKVYNSYGPTEATIASNYKEITIQQLRTNRSNNSIQLQRNNRPRKHHSWTCTQKLRNRS